MKGGQTGTNGSMCAFPQDVQKFADSLPHDPRDISMKIVKKCKGKDKRFIIRKNKIEEALEFLKKHHIEYKDIKTNQTVLDNLKQEGDDHLEDYLQRMEKKDPRETICQIIEKIPDLPKVQTSMCNKLKKMIYWKNTEAYPTNLGFISKETVRIKKQSKPKKV